MTDKFYPITLRHLLQIILNEYQKDQSIFGIPEDLFFNPVKIKQFQTTQFNQKIDTPI